MITLARLCQLHDLTPTQQVELELTGVAPLDQATGSDLAFYADAAYRDALAQTRAGAVLLSPDDASLLPDGVVGIFCTDPRATYAKVTDHWSQACWHVPLGIHPSAQIDSQATLGDGIAIGPYAVIEAGVRLEDGVVVGAGCIVGRDCVLGAGTVLHPRVTLYPGVSVGQRCQLHSGAVVGSPGFGHAKTDQGWVAIAHTGGVEVGDDVRIGANTTVDAGTQSPTRLATGVKLDNQIQVAHNVQIGEHTAVAGCVGIAGSTRVGAWCMIGGGVKIAGHLELVDGVVVTGHSTVTKSILNAGVYSGSGVIQPNWAWRKSMLRLTQLDDWVRRLQALEKRSESNER